MPLVNFAVPFFILCSFSVNFGTCPLTFHGKTCKSVVASLKPDAQENAINAFVRRQLPLSMYEVDFIERKTDTLDGKETDYLFVTLKNS